LQSALVLRLALESALPQRSAKRSKVRQRCKVIGSGNEGSFVNGNVGQRRSSKSGHCYKFGPFWQAKSRSIG
jgi:hypothetical protein